MTMPQHASVALDRVADRLEGTIEQYGEEPADAAT